MWDKIISLVEQVKTAVTLEDLADAKLLVEGILRHVVGDVRNPTTVAELLADMQEGDRRVQAAPRFLVNAEGKAISAAVTAVVTEDETVAAAILGKLK